MPASLRATTTFLLILFRYANPSLFLWPTTTSAHGDVCLFVQEQIVSNVSYTEKEYKALFSFLQSWCLPEEALIITQVEKRVLNMIQGAK